MKYVFGLVLMVFFSLVSCNSDDDAEIQCTGDPLPTKTVFVELVNADGVNLLANGTYIADDITITFGGNTMTGVVFNDVPGLENLIALNSIGEDGDNSFVIQLSDTEEDILKLNLTISESGGPCTQRLITLNTITYNDILQVPEDFFGDFKITIEKE